MIVTGMVAPRVLFPVYYLAWVLTPTESADFGGSKEQQPCPENALVDLTEGTPDYLSLVNKSGEVFTPGTTSVIDGKRLGCPCSFKTCLSLCCPFGKARTAGSCVDDDENPSTPPNLTALLDETVYRRDEVNFHTFTEDPCAVGWMRPRILKSFYVFLNGSIYSQDFDGGSLSDFEQYCLFREPQSSVYFAKVCRPLTWAEYDIFCLIVASLVLTTVFICYTVIPELRNLRGLIFRSYIVTYVGNYLCTMVAKFAIGSRSNARVYSASVFIGHLTAISCVFWLNVMCFDIWRKFRNLRPIERTKKERKIKRFVLYGIYAWVTPAILVTSCAAIMRYVPYIRNDTFGEIFKQWTTLGLITAVYLCNSFMYASTALTIRQRKKDTAQLVDSVNKRHSVNEQWFNMHVKLFLMTGGHVIMWVLWVVWSVDVMVRLLLTIEMVQSFLTFYIFLCKVRVKPFIRKRFQESLSSLNPFRKSKKSATAAADTES